MRRRDLGLEVDDPLCACQSHTQGAKTVLNVAVDNVLEERRVGVTHVANIVAQEGEEDNYSHDISNDVLESQEAVIYKAPAQNLQRMPGHL